MDLGSIAKSPPGATSLPAQRAEPIAAPSAARTDLPPDTTVQPIGHDEAVRFEPSDGAEARAALDAAVRGLIEHKVAVDPKSRDVVFQSVDKRTGEVVRQVPDEALMRIKAYAREATERDTGEGDKVVHKIA